MNQIYCKGKGGVWEGMNETEMAIFKWQYERVITD